MARLIDPGGDYAVVDNTEQVIYYRRLTSSTFDEGTILQSALRRDITKKEVQTSGATLVRIEVRWHIWSADLGQGLPPKVNDVIEDSAGIRWSVIDVDEGTLQTRWRLITVQERN